MTLVRLISDLFSDSGPDTESPTTARTDGENESVESPTVIYECRNCGTNVTADTNRCPACEGEDIVRYSID
ncbi:hypothetical protein [Natronolimnohabitans innermongolicus]|uniref:Small CPxCG-related zinc finger protein n=1 Tax=Natronolimnohabitans innermongolicus JCM 12255 TaxID=1227499 RepID=L9WGW0_9EURY|nr:hypothetical protein [Natronolimnohabitans innermongolicus]ELY48755.1 hypothetical protein C493_21756 [Natronolimnohabitans innermongolicus JCM 12255]